MYHPSQYTGGNSDGIRTEKKIRIVRGLPRTTQRRACSFKIVSKGKVLLALLCIWHLSEGDVEKMKRIAFDIDDILVDFIEVFSWLLNKNGITIKPYDAYKINTEPDLSQEEFLKFVNKAHRYWERFRPIPGALSLIGETWIVTNRPIQFVTARSIHVATDTHLTVKNILGRHIPFSIAFTHNGAKHLHLEDVDYFVDDRRKNAIELANWGMEVFIPRRKYNHIEDPPNNIHVIDDLHQLRDNLRIIL